MSPRFFAALGVPLVAGREFTDGDRRGAEPVVIVSQRIAQRFVRNGDALNGHRSWTDPKEIPWRIELVPAGDEFLHVGAAIARRTQTDPSADRGAPSYG